MILVSPGCSSLLDIVNRDRVASLRENWEEARIPEELIDEAISRLKEEFRDAYHQQKHPGKKRPRKKVVAQDDW